MADHLVLYSRPGCCLCEGLEEKLRRLTPPPRLVVVNVDDDPSLQARFGLEVPVLGWRTVTGEQLLPRVPPRLVDTALLVWLGKNGFPGGSV
ncbi:glutaredoxin family protein [Cyanobium sp. LEGE 06113]|uniref:glutaredoxin family protein n=1 Tax=Cyanobium sp. LEGE 06113 TaxID=1297573 RepID=UPI001882F0E2|nr:glutaredoxin family protein [Cyanobium sp. LEGE 06113]MBE9152678.1 glutaredoxin family protein [Cyanobium sp. LEGE 06113]MBE9153117.1 glutaredoxin family protein [Cyanobium sp. LEGE 06113]